MKQNAREEHRKRSTNDYFQAFANGCSQVAGSRWAFLSAVLLIIVWAATGPIFRYSDAWQLVVNTATTIITFLMVFLIQNAQNRDSHALHLKLDEIIRAKRSANATVGSGSQMFSSNDLFDNNSAQAVAATFGAYVEASNSRFLNNGVGIEAAGDSTVRCRGCTITASVSDGVILLARSEIVFQGSSITRNGGNGVYLEDGSLAAFLGAAVRDNMSGTDVFCAPQFPITRFVESTGGITNCVEAASVAASEKA